MRYTIENEFIRLTVDSLGAEMVSAVDLATGSEMIWCADPAVWNRHAPILFPYAGKLTGGHFKAEDGKIYAGGQHGFARDMEHTLLNQTARELTFELRSSDETRAVWPYDFALRTTFSLEGRRVRHAVSVRNVTRIPLSAELFARDSHCMVNLKSKSICVLERDTGRRIRVDIENFPYTLIWSTPQKPMRFICVEPWHSIPGEDHGPIEWAQKPCAASLEPDEVWQTALDMAFER